MKNAVTMSGLICLVAASAGPSWGNSMKADLDAIADRRTEVKAMAEFMAEHRASARNPVEFKKIPGGKFEMGTALFTDAQPIHTVEIPAFQMSKTLVTVWQYQEYYDSLTGPAQLAALPGRENDAQHGKEENDEFYNACNWGKKGRQLHPINCVSWAQASAFAAYMATQTGYEGVRLPTEAEFEYAAKSGNKNYTYPWGNDPDRRKAVVSGKTTMPVCSKSSAGGDTSQGLCDMSGNVWEWMQDTYQNSYTGAPTDGGAYKGGGTCRVVRGSPFGSRASRENLRADIRYRELPDNRDGSVGFRLARSN